MSTANPAFTDEVAFLSGVSATGTVVSPSFATLTSETNDQNKTPTTTVPTFSQTNSTAAKFGVNTAGTASGTLTFAFNPASNYTPAEQTLYLSSMALWSAEANVTFVSTNDYANATIQYTRGTDGSAYAGTRSGTATVVAVGGTTLGTPGQSFVSVDTGGTGGFGPLTSVNGGMGYPAGTVVHEIGHVLGLGHGGGYNGSATPSVQQFSQYDTGLYSIMSYIRPEDTSAKFYGSYAVANTNFGGYQGAETPMSADILALQSLYGLPTSTPLSGGQVFGFSSNITGALAPYFNFTTDTTDTTKNSQPVLTLWDAGGNNTLNLSGYTTASTVNLNPGTFSSAGGLTNNISVAFNTAINTAIGGAGDDKFTVNAAPDSIDGGAGNNSVAFSGNRADYAATRSGGVVTVTKLSNAVADTLTNISTLTFADASVATASIACFAHGTLIATPMGETAVEDFRIGDLVLTAAGEARPIKWLGRRSYAGRFFKANGKVRPIQFAAGSLGHGLPRRALRISPDHAMAIAGVLVPASALVNGATIAPDTDCIHIDYVHIELDSHDVILAEGAATETFLDDDSRAMFHNAADYAAIYGGGGEAKRFCAPRVDRGFALQAVVAALPPAAPVAMGAAAAA